MSTRRNDHRGFPDDIESILRVAFPSVGRCGTASWAEARVSRSRAHDAADYWEVAISPYTASVPGIRRSADLDHAGRHRRADRCKRASTSSVRTKHWSRQSG